MANRYSNLSTSQFDPLSLQEVMAVPLYKQDQYDKLEADRIKQAEMFKVDPLDIHKERAQQLNNDYMSKVDELANYQAKTGDIEGTKSKFLNLQREYKKLTDPMGEVSKINTAKKLYNDEKTRFLESASKQYGSSRALELWNQHAQQYKGFTDKGDIADITSRGIVENQDFMKDVQEHNKLLGDTVSSVAGSGYNIVERPEGLVMVNSSGQTIKNSNLDQVNSMRKALSAKWQDKRGEGYLFNQEAGKNQEDFNQYFKNTIDSQFKTGIKRDSNTSASFIGSKNKGDDAANAVPGIFGDDYNTAEVGSTEQDFKELSKVGSNIPNTGSIGSSYTMGTSTEGGPKQKTGKYTHKDISDPMLQARYVSTFKKLFKEGKINTTIDNPNSAKIVLNEIKKQGPIIMTSKLLTTNKDINNSGFAASLGKTEVDRDKQMRRELQMTNAGARKLLDPETGQPMSFAEAQEKYDLIGTQGITYQGYLSPLNWEKQSFNGRDSKASPHIITVKNKDGNYVEFKTSRINSDNVGVNINRYNDLQKNYRKYTVDHDQFVDFESDSPSLKGLKIKYNTKDPKVDPQRGVLNYEIMDKNGNVHNLTEAEYIQSVNSTK